MCVLGTEPGLSTKAASGLNPEPLLQPSSNTVVKLPNYVVLANEVMKFQAQYFVVHYCYVQLIILKRNLEHSDRCILSPFIDVSASEIPQGNSGYGLAYTSTSIPPNSITLLVFWAA